MTKNIIALAGPPCSGKSTVGKILAALLNAEFLDTDSMIEQDTGHSINWIFSEMGESVFRRLEKQIVSETILKSDRVTVIALGGGALLDPQSRALVEQKTILFNLTAPADVLWKRNNGKRPLAETQFHIVELLEARKEHYNSLGHQINTEKATPGEIAAAAMKEALPLLSR